MIGRKATAGLALLCAFAFCAFAAQSALAQSGTKSVNTTAVTCVETGEGFFKDAHCDEKLATKTGKFEHVPIEKDKTTQIDVTTNKTQNKTGESTTSKLNATIAGVPTEVTCSTVASVTKKNEKGELESLSSLHNVETEGKHTVTGDVEVEFNGCTVAKPEKCVVKEPIITKAKAVGVEGLNGKNEMGVEFIGSGAEKTFAELIFKNKGAESCAISNKEKPFPVKGSVIATGKVAQGEDHSGATAIYEDANEMETLEIGLKKASFAGTFTTTMFGAGGNPIAATTTT